jgi:hypothetical protein
MPRHAQQEGGAVERWEYLCDQQLIRAPRRITEWLNSHAADGWELLAVDGALYYFRRRVQHG